MTASFSPREIVSELDRHIVGQTDAKRAVAIALRNRWRRQQLPEELREEVLPKNILMIGPTGIGKTEIARRLAKLAQAPFIKVEATKFTEVGYVGRDVEQIVRDLVEVALVMTRERLRKEVASNAELAAEERVLDALVGPGAAAIDEFESRTWLDGLTPGKQLALLIAIGIGVHNFGEGLAIGQAAAASEISLAVTLIIGFGLHNATEGFGICGPMSGEGTQPSWRFLALLGVIGGAPTFFGTVLGQAWSSEAMSVVFFAVAAGSILYVVQELFAVNRKYGHTTLVMWLVLVGVLLGFATDFVVAAAGV